MKIVYFTHSLASCWNHGNAHFVRGILSELTLRGHDVLACEPENGWSLSNLIADHGEAGLAAFRTAYPELRLHSFAADDPLEAMVGDADLVIVHEWNAADLVAELGRMRRKGAGFTLLFHDTHHRAVSAPEQMRAYDLEGYDGVLAFGAALAEVYRGWGWGDRAWVWHEAADTRRFRPRVTDDPPHDLIWIGNWGDGERETELETFLLAPARAANLRLDIYGVRYPPEALEMLGRYGARYHGWAPNAVAPALFSQHLATVHVPRRFYAEMLPGIPTIRMFEALACGIPLASAPWEDSEGLFRAGADYLLARDGAEMTRHLKLLRHDHALRAQLAANGIETIRARHSCAHRVDELMTIVEKLRPTLEVRTFA
ncbi:glycosyltransferase [Sphingomonas gilva]|uniref:Glycosyltransferase n=1 Tax=Sphingomonas gilva TaxID=2305907 RepID=A0A396RMG0_9SPHN|nr:glycosyltransferase [Sphingomonas gilva]RHW17548.1 glycosyltransferase [Sphingomonas gilva]